MRKLTLLALTFLLLLTSSCFKDNDDEIQPASTLDIQNFIYRGLNYFYLYKADKAELADSYFETQNDLNAFLNGYESPEELFEYFKSEQDRFSILVDDYIELENALSGVTLHNGMEYGLVFYPDGSNNVYGYVRYVLPNTDAEENGITRGVIFNTINGTQLTEENYRSLLSQDSYTIGIATFDGETITPTGNSISLVKEQYTEDPIFIANTISHSGQNVGYLMYNAFTADFDSQLNNAFAQFQADGITNLVLDLRYNSGGSVESAKDLASMITGQFTNQVFYTEQWNEDRQDQYAEDGKFDTTLRNGEAINSLNLSTVYVLTTTRSASASELVINGLDPYINVVQVGTETTGKFQASFLLYDAPAPTFSRSQANPNHTYAMLPLVFKTANAVGNTDFIDGLLPDITVEEDYSNLGVLGEPTEPLLAAALQAIAPVPGLPTFFPSKGYQELSEQKELQPLYQLMIGNK